MRRQRCNKTLRCSTTGKLYTPLRQEQCDLVGDAKVYAMLDCAWRAFDNGSFFITAPKPEGIDTSTPYRLSVTVDDSFFIDNPNSDKP
ncbi:MAG: hypothetical protein IPJ88_13785 [Myxococcales bacterium]|nr:MAG: hypothetical protein IPJ88_13785 [Myxococcales bacterium]